MRPESAQSCSVGSAPLRFAVPRVAGEWAAEPGGGDAGRAQQRNAGPGWGVTQGTTTGVLYRGQSWESTAGCQGLAKVLINQNV